MFHIEPNSPQHLKIGKIGEDIACRYLKEKGYKIIERNFRRKWGEIDIICLKQNSDSSMWNKISKNIFSVLQGTNIYKKRDDIGDLNVPRETNNKIIFVEVKTLKNITDLKPEDNLTYFKQKKLIRTCQLYISEKNIDDNTDWQIDVILIEIDSFSKKAKVKHIESAIY